MQEFSLYYRLFHRINILTKKVNSGKLSVWALVGQVLVPRGNVVLILTISIVLFPFVATLKRLMVRGETKKKKSGDSCNEWRMLLFWIYLQQAIGEVVSTSLLLTDGT